MKDHSLFRPLSFAIMVTGLVYAYYEHDLRAAFAPKPLTRAVETVHKITTRPLARAEPVPPVSASGARPVTMTITPPPGSAAVVRGRVEGMFSEFAAHPEFARAYLEAHRAAIPAYYRGYLLQFGATDAQIRRFIDIMMKRAEEWVDLQTAVQAGEPPIGEAEIVQLDRASRVARDEALRSLFGPTAPDLLKQHKDTRMHRIFVNSLTGPALAAGEPLSHAQYEQLVRLMMTTNVGAPAGVEFEAFYRQSAALLTPTQLQLLRAAMAPRQHRHPEQRHVATGQ